MNMTKRPSSFHWSDAIAMGLRRCWYHSRSGCRPGSAVLLCESSEQRRRRMAHLPLPQSQQQQQQRPPQRFFSSISPQRQGRERFYVHVGVESCEAPWDASSSTKDETVVESPISAGVDGTDSASGVVRPPVVLAQNSNSTSNSKSKNDWMQLLRPRTPAKSLAQHFVVPNATNDDETGSTTTTKSLDDHDRSLGDWHTVTLDGRALRTPMGQALALPSKALAWTVAVEWNSVRGTIQPLQMPFMTLACTALDQVTAQPEHYRQQCMQFWQTDTVCYWADPVNERLLHRNQQKAWKRLHQWVQKDFCHGHTPGQITEQPQSLSSDSSAALFPRHKNNNNSASMGLPHPPELTEACRQWVHSLDAWHLAALHSACLESKSFLVAAAMLTQHYDARDAQTACRVEEEFQIDSWGMVEGQHDYDRLNATVQLTAASILADLLQHLHL